MSDSNSTLFRKTARRTVIELPELVTLIGHHLHTRDILSCVQISHSWNEAFVPLLWHNLDTHTKPWQRIIDDDSSARRPRDEIEQWVKTSFEKYGHHIRHLNVHWNVVLEAASLSSKCRNLCSLVVGVVLRNHLAPSTVLVAVDDDMRLPWMSGGDESGMCEDYLRCRRDVERFWMLVRHNPGLVHITFPRIGTIEDMLQDYVLETLLTMKNLKGLDLEWMPLDLPTLLNVVPQLQRLRGFALERLSSLQQDYSRLRYLSYRNEIDIPGLLHLLNHLPGLEELQLWQVLVMPSASSTDMMAIISTSALFPQLKTFRLDGSISSFEDKFISLLIGLFPSLVQLWIGILRSATRNELWQKCYFLESINGRRDAGPIVAWRDRRAKDAFNRQR
ncbi:MAG: hypothetical protein J3R72DRAFT_445055 [Linnemannia gamsii]|nr:MAG: hypothetical protein J3R72DRAFT_445055 [Linnemannia gamsii]